MSSFSHPGPRLSPVYSASSSVGSICPLALSTSSILIDSLTMRKTFPKASKVFFVENVSQSHTFTPNPLLSYQEPEWPQSLPSVGPSLHSHTKEGAHTQAQPEFGEEMSLLNSHFC